MTSTVTVVFRDAGDVAQGVPATFDATTLPAFGFDVADRTYLQRDGIGQIRTLDENVTGVSIAQLIPAQGGAISHVRSVVVTAGNRSVVLHPETGDLLAPGDPGFPFAIGSTDSSPPVVSLDSTGNIVFYISARATPTGQADVTDNGAQLLLPSGGNTSVTINLDGTLLRPTVTGPTEVAATQTATFTASLPPGTTPPGAQWSWNFGDSPNPDPDQHGTTATHAFSAAGGPYHVRATVTGSDRSSGLSPAVDVMVGKAPTNTTSPPPTTISPTDSNTPTLGNGAPTDPAGGPRDGDGPLAGGVPTDRGGTGAPGNSFDPRPSGVAATATASEGAARANGDVVGYVLSDPSRSAEIAQPGARKPRDDSAPAARTGTTAVRLSGWIVAAAVVVALLALGAGSERRRPTTTRARRKR